jgi:hypothetical protein
MVRILLTIAILVTTGELGNAQTSKARSGSRPPAPPAVQPAPADFFGKLDGGQYTNNFFGLSLTVPEGYLVLNRDEIGIYSKAAVDLMKGENERNNKAFNDAINNQAVLLMVAQKAPGSEGNAVAEMQVRKQPPGATANVVLAQSAKLMTGSAKAVLTRHLPSVRFGNRTFTGAEFEIQVGSQMLTQQLYITMQRGYAMSVGLTFAAGADRNAFNGMFSGFKMTAR